MGWEVAIIAVGLFAVGTFGVWLPTRLQQQHPGLFSCGNMLASGTLLAAGAVHVFPTAAAALPAGDDGYPWVGLIGGASFLALLLVEETLHIWIGKHTHATRAPRSNTPLLGHGGAAGPEVSSVDHGHGHGLGHGHGNSLPRSPMPPLRGHAADAAHDVEQSDGHMHGHGHEHGHGVAGPERKRAKSFELHMQDNMHYHGRHLEQHLKSSLVAGMLLLVTLDVHSILAGLAVGFGATHLERSFALIIAIAVHKVLAAFALGSTFCAIGISRVKFLILAFTFALSTPLGVIIGAALEGVFTTNSVGFGVMYAIVGGTFLYIAIIEIGIKELLVCRSAPHGSGLQLDLEQLKLFSLMAGFVVMSLLGIWL